MGPVLTAFPLLYVVSVRTSPSSLPSDVLQIPVPPRPEYLRRGCVTTAPVTVRGRDLRALAAIVSEDRPDLPDGEGLPPSLLADLMGQIRCDVAASVGFDSGRQQMSSAQLMADSSEAVAGGLAPVHWDYCWHCQHCSYPDRLSISEGTVRTHLENLYQKLNVSSRTAAVTRAFADRIA
jgi:Bacterial regulatory proteins, luxR family